MRWLHKLFGGNTEDRLGTRKGDETSGRKRFVETEQAGDWKAFATAICTDGLSGGSLSPQLNHCCRTVEVARILAERRPLNGDSFLIMIRTRLQM